MEDIEQIRALKTELNYLGSIFSKREMGESIRNAFPPLSWNQSVYWGKVFPPSLPPSSHRSRKSFSNGFSLVKPLLTQAISGPFQGGLHVYDALAKDLSTKS